MRLKSVIVALTLAAGLTACSTAKKVVYRIDVPQGNYLEAATVAKVQNGMTKEQVQYLLGTPVLVDPFSQNTWYYVYRQQQGYENPVQYTLVVNFDHNGIVTQTDLNQPLPENDNAEVNNAIINAEPTEKSWWRFWK